MGLAVKHRPFIKVAVGDRPVNDIFYRRLISASLTDNSGNEADRFEAEFDNAGNDLELPQKDDPIVVTFGYLGGGQKMGQFIVETMSAQGGASGETIRLCGHSADLRKELKQEGSGHFDNKTVGEIVGELARRNGMEAKISAELADIKLPYLARLNQSVMDFLTRLADRLQAAFLIKDGKFLFLKRGLLPPLTVNKADCESWELEILPRGRYGRIEAEYFDRGSGQKCRCAHDTGMDGPVRRLRRCYSSKAEAEAACVSEGDRLCRSTGGGSLQLAGDPAIMADQPLRLAGFRPEINGLWRAKTVTHSYGRCGYKTEISFEAPEQGRSGRGKGK